MKRALSATVICLMFIPLIKSQYYTKTSDNKPFMRDDKDVYTNKTYLKKNTNVELIEYVGRGSWKVKVKDKIGYIGNHHLIQTDYMKSSEKKYEIEQEEAKIKKQQEKDREEAQKEEERKMYFIKLFGEKDGVRIFNGYISEGDTKKMIEYALGKPDDWNTFTGGNETYIYYNVKGIYYSISFEESKVVSIYKSTGIK